MLTEAEISCPYCGEMMALLVEPLDEDQQYTEDCQVCCRPMVILVRSATGETSDVEVRREDDS